MNYRVYYTRSDSKMELYLIIRANSEAEARETASKYLYKGEQITRVEQKVRTK